jgi:FAD/FMN-containing dehydrogenase/Fe-S oxidoreductase
MPSASQFEGPVMISTTVAKTPSRASGKNGGAPRDDIPPAIDVGTLERDLRAAVSGEVRFDAGSKAVYSTDASNYRQVPIGVVVPKTKQDVVNAVKVAHRHGVPILARGGGTSLAGECCNAALVIDFSKYLSRVLEIDPENRTARVEPGCILDSLRTEANKHGLTFGPDPATHDHNTLGGMIGNDSGGMHTLMNGITFNNVRSLEILTYDGVTLQVGPTSEDALRATIRAGGREGEIYRKLSDLRDKYEVLIKERFPKIPRRVSGYENLDQLFAEKGCNVARALVGTEGTCVIVLEAALELIPNPRARIIAVMGFPDIFIAADTIPRVLEFKPIGLEGMDKTLVKRMRLKHLHEEDLDVLPKGDGWLIVEFGGNSADDAAASAKKLVDSFAHMDGVDARVIQDKTSQARLWNVRDSALGAESYVPNHPDTWPGWEDSAVPRENLGRYLRDLNALFHKYGYDPCLYGHFGDGLVHCTVDFDLYDAPGVATWRRFLNEAADLVVSYGGSLSGEHGDGQARGELLVKMYGAELVNAFREFKAIWDPLGRMNPGKVVDPYPITSNLRVGPSYHPPKLETHFSFPLEGNFARAAQRCVGVGKCRRHDSGNEVMCPSYLATHEEKHSTRGRSRLLFEMLHGGAIEDCWKSEAVEEALDLCLACKGCKSDCPVNVDMATYKSEFRSHYFEGRFRPRVAYGMGRIHELARIASKAPWLFNALARTPGLSALAKSIGGIAQQRTIPPFAQRSFVSWFRKRRGPAEEGRPRVMLWPDTFNNYFRPRTAIAATLALEEAGYHVVIPSKPLCCGRPLYDWGWLDDAKALWRDTMSTLQADIEAGTPLIGLEPACTSAFRDELPQLFPGDKQAEALSKQTAFFSDFLAQDGVPLLASAPKSKALVQMHCHQHAVIKDKGERKLLDKLGVSYRVLESGCCGMAGSFGFEADKYALSQQIGERVLLPAVRHAENNTLILSNGFSCREQIEQGTGRATLHIAELTARALGLEV